MPADDLQPDSSNVNVTQGRDQVATGGGNIVAKGGGNIAAGGGIININQYLPAKRHPARSILKLIMGVAAALTVLITALVTLVKEIDSSEIMKPTDRKPPPVQEGLESVRTRYAQWLLQQETRDVTGVAIRLDQLRISYQHFTNLLSSPDPNLARQAANRFDQEMKDFDALIANRDNARRRSQEVQAMSRQALATKALVFAPKTYLKGLTNKDDADKKLQTGDFPQSIELFGVAAADFQTARQRAEGFQVETNRLLLKIHLGKELSPGKVQQEARAQALAKIALIFREEYGTILSQDTLSDWHRKFELVNELPTDADGQVWELAMPLDAEHLKPLLKAASP